MSTLGGSGSATATARWKRLVRGRLAEAERLRPGGGATGADYWNEERAKSFSNRVTLAESDPFLGRLRRVTGARTTVLDVGAGAGRFTLALAPRAAEVVAVDPSEPMVKILRRRARQAGVANVRCIVDNWETADVSPADVVLSAHVLPLVPDAARFVRKLDACAVRHAFLYIGAFVSDAVFDPFWRHFHGRPRSPGATWVDAVEVLRELDIEPDVQIVELPYRARFSTVDEAVRDYADQLLIPDSHEARRELQRLVEPWLVRRKGGWGPPIRTMPAAILHWHPQNHAG